MLIVFACARAFRKQTRLRQRLRQGNETGATYILLAGSTSNVLFAIAQFPRLRKAQATKKLIILTVRPSNHVELDITSKRTVEHRRLPSTTSATIYIIYQATETVSCLDASRDGATICSFAAMTNHIRIYIYWHSGKIVRSHGAPAGPDEASVPRTVVAVVLRDRLVLVQRTTVR
eukprot:6210666-Pleurochrysis_carterae.AAC.1